MRRLTICDALILFVASGAISGCSLARIAWNAFGNAISVSPSRQTTTKCTTTTSETEPEAIEPGIYMFKAKVKGVWLWPIGRNKILEGIATIDGERWVFTGIDINWAIKLDVQEAEKPLWFLKAGELVTIVVHSPFHVFGKDGCAAVGETWQFSLVIERGRNGSLSFGPLTTPKGALREVGGFPRREPVRATQPADDLIEPGVYRFRAKVKGVLNRTTGIRGTTQGVATEGGERCVFTGHDANWAIQLDVQEVEKPLWFLKAGEPVTIMVHSPSRVFRGPYDDANGKEFEFSFEICREADGSLRYGPLTKWPVPCDAASGRQPQ